MNEATKDNIREFSEIAGFFADKKDSAIYTLAYCQFLISKRLEELDNLQGICESLEIIEGSKNLRDALDGLSGLSDAIQHASDRIYDAMTSYKVGQALDGLAQLPFAIDAFRIQEGDDEDGET